MNDRKVLAGALSASLLLGALPGLALAQSSDPEITPEGVEWTLNTLAGESVPDGVTTTLFLSGGEVVGNAGCNSYFGNYELDGDSLIFPNPFGATQKFCEDSVMAIEATYLPLLQETATWAIDEAGALSLADADGMVQLVDVTASDVDALVATLGDLQAQIDEASAKVAAVAAETEAIPVNRFDRRVQAVETSTTQLDRRVTRIANRTQGLNGENIQKRLAALEETTTRLDRTIDRFRDRLIALEATVQKHEQRISALEDAVSP
jgi:heat shock protein HslJ